MSRDRPDLLEVFAFYSENVNERSKEIFRANFRSFDIDPDLERVLVDRFFEPAGIISIKLQVAGNDLDIEDPFGQEGIGENAPEIFVYPKQLCSALRVVDRQPQHHGNHGCKCATQIVT